jgi:bacillithiol system protein YtxJ
MPAKLTPLSSLEQLTDALRQPEVIVYKHSSICWSSMVAHRHVRKFAASRPDVLVFFVDVLQDRDVSNEIASLLNVRHESPQLLIVQDGVAVWDTSHYRITQDALEQQFAAL